MSHRALFHSQVPPTLAHMPSALDQRLFLFLNADRGHAWLDTLMAVLSSFDFWLPLMIVAGLLVAWRGGFRARAMLACLLLSLVLIEAAFVNPLKHAFGRPRPTDMVADSRSINLAPIRPRILALLYPIRVKPGSPDKNPPRGRSFPSGHASNMFCFATILAAFYGMRGASFFILAASVALSRVMTGSHWPSDVVISALLSIALTSILLRLYNWLWVRFGPRMAPLLAAKHRSLFE
ncbi:MAG: phosphatase PAP2 family protein [Chthoniobacterales bacterium]